MIVVSCFVAGALLSFLATYSAMSPCVPYGSCLCSDTCARHSHGNVTWK